MDTLNFSVKTIQKFLIFFLISVSCAMETDRDEKKPSLYDYELFKTVQRIYEIADEVRVEAKESGTEIDGWKFGWPGVNPSCHQTVDGLFAFGAEALWTPWGECKLTGGGCGTWTGFGAARQTLLKRLKTTFFNVTRPSFGCDRDRIKFYELRDSSTDLKDFVLSECEFEDLFKEVSKSELEAKKGTDVFIVSTLCGYGAVYSLSEVDGHKLPEPSSLMHRNYSEYEDVEEAWRMLKERFDKEKSE